MARERAAAHGGLGVSSPGARPSSRVPGPPRAIRLDECPIVTDLFR